MSLTIYFYWDLCLPFLPPDESCPAKVLGQLDVQDHETPVIGSRSSEEL